MKKKYIILMYIAFFSFFLLCISPFIKQALESNCTAYQDFLKDSYSGIVVKKYINREQHSYKTVEIKNFSANKINVFLLDFDISGFYDKININDTIYKATGIDTVYLTNRKGKFGYILDFNCKK